MKIIKTALAFLLIGILSISLCACSADQEDNFSTKIKNKIELINSHEFVLRVEEETSEISKSDRILNKLLPRSDSISVLPLPSESRQ